MEPFSPDQSLRIRKKIAKKFKKLKNIILASLPAETGRDKQKKRETFFWFGTVFSRPELKNYQKKIEKKLKNIILDSFQVETGRDRLKKGEKIFLVRNRFYLT